MNNFWTQLKKPILALAPMAGVTDTAFRQVCKSYGADVIYTEFASADALVYESAKTRAMISFAPQEQPVVCQIFGRKPEVFARAVTILEEMGFAGVDINFGCPAYKVVKGGGGVSLMRNLNLCHELVQAACEATKLPISIKMRASIKRGQATKDKIEGEAAAAEAELDAYECELDVVTALDLVHRIKELPVAAIMIHGRSFEHPFDGEPNYGVIAEVRKVWRGILIANGGIHTPEKAKEVLEETGADGVGIARGSWGKPWLFQQIKDYLATGTYRELSWAETTHVMQRHADLALQAKGEHGLLELRKHLGWYTKGMPGASAIRAQLVRVNTIADVEAILTHTAAPATMVSTRAPELVNQNLG